MLKLRLLGFCVFLLISLAWIYVCQPEKFEEFNHSINYYLPILSGLNILVFLLLTSKLFKSWVRFEVFFLIGFFIVHFQIPYQASIGIEPVDPGFIWINKQVVNYATWMSALALHLWMLGYTSYLLLEKYRIKNALLLKEKKFMFFFDIVIGVLFLSFLFLVGTSFLSGDYAGTKNWGPGATYVFLLMNSCLFLRVIHFFKNASVRSANKDLYSIIIAAKKNPLIVFIVFSYLPLFLLLGDRGPVMQLGVMILGAYSIYFKRIGFVFFSSLVLIGAFVFMLVGLGRGDNRNEGGVLESGLENYSQSKESINPTYELASAVRNQYRVLDIIPRYHPHVMGGIFGFQLIGIIPFAGKAMSFVPPMYYSSAMFFTIWSQGPNYSWGEGTEILADLYLNFGLIISLIIMFLFGVLISSLSFSCIVTKKDYVVIIYLAFLIFALYINRASILQPVKIMVYMLVINALIPSRNLKSAG